MLFKHKKWVFFVYYRKTKKDYAVKQATTARFTNEQIAPPIVVENIRECCKIYLDNDQYAGMNIVEFLTKALNET